MGKIPNFIKLGPHGERPVLDEKEVTTRLLGVGFCLIGERHLKPGQVYYLLWSGDMMPCTFAPPIAQ